MKKQVIIVAGGKGLRMGTELPKQFLPVGGRPVLMHTLERFYEYDASIKIILVLPNEQQDYWRGLCEQHEFSVPYCLADGGETRFHSVRNGLKLTDAEGLVGVHDGVRPFVSPEVIERCFLEAEKTGTAVPVMELVDSLRQLLPCESSRVVDRALYRLVQTPQIFKAELLYEAYKQPFNEAFTDDASVVENMNLRISLVQGNRENIKITTPLDLKIAELLYQDV